MAHSAESKEQGSNGYVHSVKTSSNEENGAVDIFASGKLNTVFVLVCLAEQEGNTK